MLQLFDHCIILILLNVSLLAPMSINCRLLRVRGWLSIGMVVIQPYILVSKLKKTKTKFLRCTGYLNSVKDIQSKFIAKSCSCMATELSKLLTLCLTTVKNMLLSTVRWYVKDLVRIYFGLL